MSHDGASVSAAQPDTPTPQLGRWRVPDAVFIAGTLLIVTVVGALSLTTQPNSLATAAWWPNAGIALGLGIRFRRRYTWMLALGVAAATLPVVLWAGRPPALAIALTTAAAIEMIVGTWLLRGRRDTTPTLSAPSDLARFLAVALASAVLYGILAWASSTAVGDLDGAFDRLVTSAPKHAAGMVLLTPLFMNLTRRRQRASAAESLAQVVAALAVAGAVFVGPNELPLAFLPFLPLVWAALRMSTRRLFLLMLAIAVIASVGSGYGMGPFAFDRLGPAAGTVILQVFQLSMVVVFLALSLVVGAERDALSRLHESEELFRTSFDSSVAGKLMVSRGPRHWTVERSNPSARELFPELRDGDVTLDMVLGPDAIGELRAATDSLAGGNARLTLRLEDGRSLNVSLAVIAERPDSTLYVMHFQDVTEALRARQLEQEQLDRAAEVQRALLPAGLPQTPGWTFGTASRPALQVGGDFYDVRVQQQHAVLCLGDVMGKGMDAGMLAAATRTALRAHDADTSPSHVVSDAARILGGDLHRINAFVTLAYLLVDLDTGEYRLADAGHGLHFVVRAGSGRVERLASDDMPLGVDDRWCELSGKLAPGDTILLVSDGVLDLWGGLPDQLQCAVAECSARDGVSPQAVVDALCADAGAVLDEDDITAVALRRNP
ncbi:MAG: SpoIIE family protein phosphatase [Actinomycetota bacterium]|nr:SpoIIE family protein phosphatase [Actinomycetota bacterium]